MPRSKTFEAPLWRYFPDHRIGAHEQTSIEEARACTDCAGGLMNRLAERQFQPPYRWIPVGYRCNKCGTMFVFKRSLV